MVEELTVSGESSDLSSDVPSDMSRNISFDAFFADRFVPLSRLAFLLTGVAEAADEIAQDACEQVLRRWDVIQHPRAYARIAVINGSRSWGRRRSVRRAAPRDRGRDAELGVDADTIAVRDVLAELPERQREVLVLRFYADLKVDDIASELDVPAGTVKSLIHRGLARMQEELA